MGSMPELWTVHLGVVPYREALELQHRVRAARQADAVPDVLLLLEHPPTYTRGRRSAPGELARGEAWYRDQGIEVVGVDRGGKVTYHGPGQLVGYPIVRTGDVIAHVRTHRGRAHRRARARGRRRPQPARGRPRLHRRLGRPTARSPRSACTSPAGVTTHGFAVNVDNDLDPFTWVVACGLPDVTMTSVARETGRTGRLPCLRRETAFRFAQAHGLRQRLVSADRLHAALGAARVPAASVPA